MNILTLAVECDTGDAAALLVQNALGIEDGGVADYCFPKTWPKDIEQRRAILGEWLATEARYA